MPPTIVVFFRAARDLRRTLLLGLVATCFVALAPAARATLLSEWNLIVRDNVVTTSEVDGSTLVGGNLAGTSSYTIHEVTAANGDGLAVGGNITSGNIHINQGGNLRIGGSIGGTVDLNGGGTTIVDTTVASAVSADFVYLNQLSQALAALPANGTLDGGGNLNAVPVVIGSETVAIYDLAATSFNGLGQLNLNFGSATTVILNIGSGGSGNVNFVAPPNMIGGFNQGNSAKILWNLYDATQVTTNNTFNGACWRRARTCKWWAGASTAAWPCCRSASRTPKSVTSRTPATCRRCPSPRRSSWRSWRASACWQRRVGAPPDVRLERRDDFQQLDGRLAIQMDQRRAAVSDLSWRHAEQPPQILTRRHLPHFSQVDFGQQVVLDQNPSQRGLLTFDFAPHCGADGRKIKSHDPELHDHAIGLPGQQNLAGVEIAFDPGFQHAHVDGPVVKPLDRDRHVAVVGQQHAIVAFQVVPVGFLELPQLVGLRVEQPNECIQIRSYGARRRSLSDVLWSNSQVGRSLRQERSHGRPRPGVGRGRRRALEAA